MDKIDKLFDAIEHPEHYDDSELSWMFVDPEIKEVMEVLDKTKSSLQAIPVPDVEEEWRVFVDSHSSESTKPISSIIRFFTRNFAASVAIGLASLTTVAAVVSLSVGHDRNGEAPLADEVVVADVQATVLPDSVVETGDLPVTPEIVIFDNEPLEGIIGLIAEHYGCTITFRSDASKSLRLYFRWNQALSLEEVVESLNNFDQIHMTVNGTAITID